MTELLANTQFGVGEHVRIKCSDEGYSGQTGKVIEVFPSGRCQVAVGDIAILNLPPEGIERAVLD